MLNSGDGVRSVSAGRQGSQHLQAGEQTQNKPDKNRQDIQGLCRDSCPCLFTVTFAYVDCTFLSAAVSLFCL